MDLLLARRLDSDPNFRAKLVKLAKDYLKIGRDSLAYWSNDFDMAYDLFSCYSPLNKKDMEALERGNPKRFILPMTATQITTMTTYIAQVLFGQETPWKVEGRRPEDDVPAEFVNQLLRWNAEQQPTYPLGYLWVQDAMICNRGVFYNSFAPILKPQLEMTPVQDPQNLDENGSPQTYFRPTRKNKVVGNYCKLEIVSPYDFISDPSLPLWRIQEMRFCGHRTVIPVVELRRRSKLDPSHPSYVLPSAVKDLVEKAKKGIAQADAAVPSLPGVLPNPAEIRLSRTAYERTRSLQPTGQVQADKNDTGNVECWELWVKLVPSENQIYEDGVGDEAVLFQILIAGGDVLLAINESTYAHGEFPYNVAEGRPNAHFQFSPSWVTLLKGIQDYVDWLKNRHQEALSRTIGNIFVFDPSMVDVEDFMNPDKEGLLIALKPEAYGKNIKDMFQQVPLKDMTENFLEEAMQFINFSESVTAASSGMQGAQGGGDNPSATQFAGTQQMGAGRLTSIARLLSVQGLVPQAKQIVSNFQQFLTEDQIMRFKPTDVSKIPPELIDAASVTINRDTIAGEYGFIAHDGTLPGTNGQKVAAITRLLESAQGFPQAFEPKPGNLNPKRIILDGAKATGLNVESYTYTAQDVAAMAPPAPPGMPPGPGGPPGALPQQMLPPVQPPGMPQSPGPAPATPALPPVIPPVLENVAPPQARPTNT